MPRKKSDRPLDPSTGKPVRAPRQPMTQQQKDVIIGERIKLGRILSDEDLPDSVRGEAVKLLSLGSTQLLRRVEKANG